MSVAYDTSEALLAEVRDGGLDLAFVALGAERVPAGLDHRLLVEEPLVAVVPPGHRLASRERIDVAELAGDELIWFSRGTGLRRAVEAACARAGMSAVVAAASQKFEIGLVTEMIRLVGYGVGVTVVPWSAVLDGHDGVRVLALTDRAAVHRVGVVHREDQLSAAATAFLECIDI